MLKRAAQGLFFAGIFLCTSFLWAADEPGLVYGAGTLGHKKMAASLDFGFFKPLQLYDVRFDIGLGERFQFGLSGSYFQDSDATNVSIGSYNKMNFFRSENQKHLLSAQMDAHYSYSSFEDGEHVIFLNPALLYEFRPATKKPTGVYAGLGVLSTVVGDDANNADDFFTFSTRKNTHVLDVLAGVQHQFGKRFSLSFDGDFLCRLNNREDSNSADGFSALFEDLFKSNYGFSAKLGLHWAF